MSATQKHKVQAFTEALSSYKSGKKGGVCFHQSNPVEIYQKYFLLFRRVKMKNQKKLHQGMSPEEFELVIFMQWN